MPTGPSSTGLFSVNIKGVLHLPQARDPGSAGARRRRHRQHVLGHQRHDGRAEANGVYAATKGAVDALTKAAAVEVATDGISVNALAFAAIDIPDDMFWRFLDEPRHRLGSDPARRSIGQLGRPEELVAAVRYLCSDDARFVTGTTLVLDGGYTAQ